MKGVNSKNGRTITTILFVLVLFILGSFDFEFLNVQAESIDEGDEDKLLEIQQGDFLHYFVRGSEGLTFQLDVKDPELVDLFNWHILVPPIHGGASVSAEGKSTEVSYLPAEAYSGDDHFLVEVSTNTGAKARVNVAVTVTPGDPYPEVENLQKPERGEPIYPPKVDIDQEFPRDRSPEGHRVDKPGMWEDEQDERFDLRLVEINALREMDRQAQLDEINRSSDGEGERGEPYISVLPQWKQVDGIGWSPNTSIILTIGTQEWTEESDENGCVRFFIPFDITAGHVVEMTDGTSTRNHTVTSLTVTDIDEIADTVSGTAAAGSDVYISGTDGYDSEPLSVTVDSSGDWTAEFTILDIAPGACGYAWQNDAEGNSTHIYWFVPDPNIDVYPESDKVIGDVWSPDTTITLTIGTQEWIEESDMIGWVWFNIYDFDIQPGQVVEMTDGTYTRTHTVTSLAVTKFDEIADTVSGTSAAGSDVHIDGSDDYDSEALSVTADSSGDWTATFSIIDIAPGADGYAYQNDTEGNSTIIDWDVPDPRIQVYPLGDYIYGYEWAPNTPVTLQIDDTVIANVDSDERGWVEFYPESFDITVGQVVEMTDGSSTRNHTVKNLAIVDVDEDLDVVTGTADAFSEIKTYACDDYNCHSIYPTADDSGSWSTDYSGYVDIAPGAYGYAWQYDAEGNSTNISWNIPDPYFDPYFQVYPLGDYIYGYEWTPDTMITATVGGSIIGSGWSDGDGDLYISASFDLQPEVEVVLTDSTYTRTHIVKDIHVTDINQASDTVAGTAEPLSELFVSAYGSDDWDYRRPVADESGLWSADFSGYVDFVPGSYGWAIQHDEEGNSTLIRWFVPDPYMRIFPEDDRVYGYAWPPDTTITLNIEGTEWTGVSSYNGWVSFYDESFDIQVGQSVTMSGGTFTKVHEVRNLSVISIDEVNDTLSGTAKANDPVDVSACDYNCTDLTVTANGSGNWSADFSGSVDIAQGVSGSVIQYDADGDSTRISWYLLDPVFEVHPLGDYIYGWDWTPNTAVTLEIDSTLIATEDSSWWGDVYFYPESFDIQPGQEVVLSDGTYTKNHTVIDLAVTTVDEANDILSGTADPGPLTVDAYDDYNWEMLYPVADANGDWTANFSTVDITEGTRAQISQSDEDNDSTFIYWLIPDPFTSAQPQNDIVIGYDWPQNTDITLTIEYTRETLVEVETSSEYGSVYFELEPFDLQPGDIVTMTAGTYAQEHTVQDISVTEIDQILDTLSGIADPGSEVQVCAYFYNGLYVTGACINTTADGSGIWLADFAGSVDIAPDSWGGVYQYDENDNYTYVNWEVSIELYQIFLPLIVH